MAHDAAYAASRTGAEATLTSLFERSEMTAADHEVEDAMREGVTILDGVMPLEVMLNDEGRATALRMAKCKMEDGRPVAVEGTEFELECDLIVSAIGQSGDLTGLEELDNGRGLMDSDKFYAMPNRPGHFVAGDIVRPHLLTTAIGQASIATESIDHYLRQVAPGKRPKVDVHHFNLLQKLKEAHLEPEEFDAGDVEEERGTSDGNWAVHNYEDRSGAEIITTDHMFLGHFEFTPRLLREEAVPDSEAVLGHFQERVIGLSTEQAVEEGRALHELRHVLRMRQLRRLLPAGCRLPGQEGQEHHGALRRYALRSLHRLPHLFRCLPDRVHRHGPGTLTVRKDIE